jgi:hypothetical protein
LRAAAVDSAAAELFAAAERSGATRGLIIPAERVPAQAVPQRLTPTAVADRTRRLRIAAVAVVVAPAAVVAVMPAVVVDMKAAADAGKLERLHHAAELSRSGGA